MQQWRRYGTVQYFIPYAQRCLDMNGTAPLVLSAELEISESALSYRKLPCQSVAHAASSRTCERAASLAGCGRGSLECGFEKYPPLPLLVMLSNCQ